MAATANTIPSALRRRLLNDIAEIQQEPYPNVHLHVHDANITNACLILSPPQQRPLHLTIQFHSQYPLRAPVVTIQSTVRHPNVFNSYICASILNTDEGWTPAYTLKGIMIQLLSFFSSDKLEQEGGDDAIDLAMYRRAYGPAVGPYQHVCTVCGFDEHWVPASMGEGMTGAPVRAIGSTTDDGAQVQRSKLFEMSDEVILNIMSCMDTADVIAFADAVPTIKHMLHSYDFIRIRELQCFCLKKSFLTTKLGIGVSITGGNRPVFRSEFDLLSNEAYNQFHIRKSIQGVEFDRWLPLPLSRRHWSSVRRNANLALEGLHSASRVDGRDKVTVLYHFMNTIVVQFSMDANRSYNRPDERSTLTHASEKAVESYFALFHLLLCFATEDVTIITAANHMVLRFLDGPRTKTQFPDLGHVLVAALISDGGLTEDLTIHIIKEAVLRNVVWMLDTKGAAMAELAYLEPTETSAYRLAKTFEASRTSYRLLMFLKLFSSTARKPGKSLIQLRDELFDTHGAPPPGTSAIMAQKIRKIHEINSFPGFLTAMGIKEAPTASEFSLFLKRTIGESVDAGYSCMPMTQSQLYMIRRAYEPGVEASKEVDISPGLQQWYERGEKWYANGWNGRPSFFPGRGGNSGRGRGGVRGGGRGRGWR